MVKKFNYAQKKLLKKTDFMSWEVDHRLHELKKSHKFRINSEDYTKYNKLSRHIRKTAEQIKELDAKSSHRAHATAELLNRLYVKMVPMYTPDGPDCHKAIIRRMQCDFSVEFLPVSEPIAHLDPKGVKMRRLSTILVKNHMAENITSAVTFIEQGHVRVGPELVTDAAFLVTRRMEDFITWAHGSKIKQHVLSYAELRDDYNMAV